MSGNRTGGLKTAIINKATNPDFYKEIGRIGGMNSTGGGFTNNSELARKAAAIGGRRSRPGYKFISETDLYMYYIRKSDGKKVKFEKH